MGQVLRILNEEQFGPANALNESNKRANALPDLSLWPPELSLRVLSKLDATNLCLASCVWQELAKDEVLWRSLCISTWGHTSAYDRCNSTSFSYAKLYLDLDEGSITFNADPFIGMEYFIKNELVKDEPAEIAKFFFHSRTLKKHQLKKYLYERQDILDQLVSLQTFYDTSLPDALRRFFSVLSAPNKQDHYLEALINKFSIRFCECNPTVGLNSDTVYILCYSLIMLSVDLASPHVKNKMSKREFIRNVRYALQKMDDEMYGHLYDDIYLRGHIALSTGA
ncbi:F-box only protein 8 [Halotydeus destructor]|nr:F-box only protein 8 [Halotydeus destructor]